MSTIPAAPAMQRLPNFADLMMIPKVVDSNAVVYVKENVIHIRTEHLPDVLVVFQQFPHVKPVKLSHRELALTPVRLLTTFVLASHPNGSRTGFLLFNEHWYSTVEADTLDKMMAAGLPVRLLECELDDTEPVVFQRLAKMVLAG